MKQVFLVLCVFLLLICGCGGGDGDVETGSGTVPSISKLAGGNWYTFGLWAGEPSGWIAWEIETGSYSTSGVYTSLYSLDSEGGTTLPSPIQFFFNDPVITVSGDTDSHGVTNSSYSLTIGNDYDNNDFNPVLYASVKQGGSFSAVDLQGVWVWHMMGRSSVDAGWARGFATVAANGTCTFTTTEVSTGALFFTPASLLIDANGLITDSGDATFHAKMTQDKNLIVYTFGPAASSAPWGMVVMGFAVKHSGTYTLSDLNDSSWYFHNLHQKAGGPNGYIYGQTAITNGNATFSNYVENGLTEPNLSDVFSISADGIISSLDYPTFKGMLSPAKDLMIYTFTDSGGRVVLGAAIK